MTFIEEDTVTTAVIEMLREAMASSGVAVYDHEAPADRDFPYVVVYRIPGGTATGPFLYDPDADLTIPYQIDAVGARRDSAEWAAGKVGRVMVGHANGVPEYALPLPDTARECGRMRTDLGGVEPEGLPPNRVFTVPNRYEVTVTPS